ncbi:MAG: hypothetical protein A2020_00525 [Lentisphaerae bacterium GWF2_45_14]|nr:MAG: hypothetical protein A2020_00525 [Lentisphaerae bacterium GWF2_45_14]
MHEKNKKLPLGDIWKMTVRKENIAENFSRSSFSYAEHAFVQKRAAGKLYDMLNNLNPQPEKIIEIGCGTGFLTEKLFAGFPEASFLICDLSDEMLKRCKTENPELRGNVVYKACDALDALAFPETFDLAVSGLTFQWMEDTLPVVIKNIYEKLNHGGALAFSTLTDKTFPKLREAFASAGSIFPGPQLYPAQDIRSMCSIFETCRFSEETEYVDFASPLDFLRHIKRTGAGNASGKPIPPSILKKAIEYLAGENNGTLREEYHLMFCYLKKS